MISDQEVHLRRWVSAERAYAIVRVGGWGKAATFATLVNMHAAGLKAASSDDIKSNIIDLRPERQNSKLWEIQLQLASYQKIR